MVLLALAALAAPCRDPAALLAAVEALDPPLATCLEGVSLGPAGLTLVAHPDGSVTGRADTDTPQVEVCLATRLEALSLSPAECVLQLTWPVSVDAWPASPRLQSTVVDATAPEHQEPTR